MAAGVMNTLLGYAVAADAASSVTISAMTLVVTSPVGTKTGAANIWIHAIGGSLYFNYGATASAAASVGVIAEGAPMLIPAGWDVRVIAKDTGAKVGATWCR